MKCGHLMHCCVLDFLLDDVNISCLPVLALNAACDVGFIMTVICRRLGDDRRRDGETAMRDSPRVRPKESNISSFYSETWKENSCFCFLLGSEID